MKIINLYFIIMSFITFFLMYTDKQKAIKNEWRIPESTFISLSLLGGSIGTYLGIYTFRHKTKHPKFTIGVPLCIIFNMFLYYLLLNCIIY